MDYSRYFGLEKQRWNRLIRLTLGQHVGISGLFGTDIQLCKSSEESALKAREWETPPILLLFQH